MLSKTSLLLLVSTLSAAWAAPQGVTSRLDASGSISMCTMSYPSSFGIAVVTATPSASDMGASATIASQLSHGQAQVPTSAATIVSQISDGQPQAPTSGAKVVTQISDGQAQAPTSRMNVVSQIGEGQVQAPQSGMNVVTQIGDGQVQAPTAPATHVPQSTMNVVTQIGDGQVQAPVSEAPACPSASNVVTQIGDGQVQAPMTTSAPVVSQISDGQVQAPTSVTAVSQINDGQVQNNNKNAESDAQKHGTDFQMSYVCSEPNSTLTLTLKNGILMDNMGRQGYIASNRQFQFDMPIQAGAIITAGFGACSNGSISLGGSTVFYQCLSGDFYNLYDQSIGGQCHPVHLEMVNLVDC